MTANANFLSEDFLLETETGRALYHDFAARMPICDFHCHLPPKDIAEDTSFENLTRIWLAGDHYKWRAMRANGVAERFITGDAGDEEKFRKWAETVPMTIRNPLFHWTHLELKRYFGVEGLLSPDTAKEIYRTCSEKLRTPGYSVKNLITSMRVKVLCTVDDPLSDLAHHRKAAQDGFPVRVLPTFRPDAALAIDKPAVFNPWINSLQRICDISIAKFDDLVRALAMRHTFFHENGCRISDHGVEAVNVEEYTASDVDAIFSVARQGRGVSDTEARKYQSALLFELCGMNHDRGWAQQIHYGAVRNTNSRAFARLGPDTGYDSIGDGLIAKSLAKFLDKLEISSRLAKTIVYNINPAHFDVIATLIGSFQDGSVPGKMQLGSGWWFLDQKSGIESQLNALSNHGSLARFVGMVTDSRSFLSYPRHEYFRRVLCNLIGKDVDAGLLPGDGKFLGTIVENICYHNAMEYLGLSPT